MRFMIAFLLLCCSCVFPHTAAPPTLVSVDSGSRTLRLVGSFGIGHACPCNGVIFTAYHVANPLLKLGTDYSGYKASYRWSTIDGKSGIIVADRTFPEADLSTMRLMSGDKPSYYSLSKDNIKVGDVVMWMEYSDEKPFTPAYRRARVVSIVSGHISFYPAPVPGASGSCLLNDKNEVVGIVTWGVRTRLGVSGTAVSLIGDWWPK